MAKTIVTLNAGSSSFRLSAYEVEKGGLSAKVKLSIRGLPHKMVFQASGDEKKEVADDEALGAPHTDDPHGEALDILIERLERRIDRDQIAAFSHRVVHGGETYDAAAAIDDAVLKTLDALTPLAPSHQPHNLRAIRQLRKAFPDIPQIACFDTSFHKSMPWEARTFALPKEIRDKGVQRYGFHGLSYAYIAGALDQIDPQSAKGRVIVAHLGHGVSMCAMNGGKSVATTMGLTALDGLPMGNRCGSIDPGAVLHLITELGYGPLEVRDMLYKRSGLYGVSGVSDAMIDLLHSEADGAKRAVDLFVYRCQREIGSLAAALAGVDALVFTGGIGENSAELRARITAGLAWLGIAIDPQRNEAGEISISSEGSSVKSFVIPTDEEVVLARQAVAIC